MKDDTAVVLASALATRVSWTRPFGIAPAAELGPGRWASRLGEVLRTPESGHDAFIAQTSRAGRVAAHTAQSREGLAVTSVVADQSVPAADVLAAAYEVALAGDPARVSLFELPLGAGPLWTITERQATVIPPREERCAAVLPAWEASSSHDLSAPSLGFGEAGRALIGLLRPGHYKSQATQAAMARYSRTGFEAAAVTDFGVAAAMMIEPQNWRAARGGAALRPSVRGGGCLPRWPVGLAAGVLRVGDVAVAGRLARRLVIGRLSRTARRTAVPDHISSGVAAY